MRTIPGYFKGKYICPKCGTTFYGVTPRPHCPKDNYGAVKRCSLGAQVNTSIVVGVKA